MQISGIFCYQKTKRFIQHQNNNDNFLDKQTLIFGKNEQINFKITKVNFEQMLLVPINNITLI